MKGGQRLIIPSISFRSPEESCDASARPPTFQLLIICIRTKPSSGKVVWVCVWDPRFPDPPVSVPTMRMTVSCLYVYAPYNDMQIHLFKYIMSVCASAQTSYRPIDFFPLFLTSTTTPNDEIFFRDINVQSLGRQTFPVETRPSAQPTQLQSTQ